MRYMPRLLPTEPCLCGFPLVKEFDLEIQVPFSPDSVNPHCPDDFVI